MAKMTDFMVTAVPTLVVEKPKLVNKQGEEIITLSVRVTRSQWENLMGLMTAERLKIQPYFKELVKADFERRGLRF